MRPGAEFAILLDAGVEVSDAATTFGDGLTVEFEHEAKHAVRGRVLRSHIDHDALFFVRTDLGSGLIPITTGDGVDRSLGGLARRCVWVSEVSATHRYDLRRSGGGMTAPLYSTSIPPSG